MFKLNLPPELQARIEARRAEMERLYGLTDEWLAHALLKLARKAQSLTPRHTPENPTYNSDLIWGLVPELARRLGTVRLTTREIDWEIRDLTDYELRGCVGHTLANIGCSTLPGWDMLTRVPANGNPVVFAVDRLCPGNLADCDDKLTQRLHRLAKSRGTVYGGVWTPEMMAISHCSTELIANLTRMPRANVAGSIAASLEGH